MNELEFRNMYATAMVEVVGAAPASVFDQPLNPVMLKFAEMVIRKCAGIADDLDGYMEYDMSGDMLAEFGLTR